MCGHFLTEPIFVLFHAPLPSEHDIWGANSANQSFDEKHISRWKIRQFQICQNFGRQSVACRKRQTIGTYAAQKEIEMSKKEKSNEDGKMRSKKIRRLANGSTQYRREMNNLQRSIFDGLGEITAATFEIAKESLQDPYDSDRIPKIKAVLSAVSLMERLYMNNKRLEMYDQNRQDRLINSERDRPTDMPPSGGSSDHKEKKRKKEKKEKKSTVRVSPGLRAARRHRKVTKKNLAKMEKTNSLHEKQKIELHKISSRESSRSNSAQMKAGYSHRARDVSTSPRESTSLHQTEPVSDAEGGSAAVTNTNPSLSKIVRLATFRNSQVKSTLNPIHSERAKPFPTMSHVQMKNEVTTSQTQTSDIRNDCEEVTPGIGIAGFRAEPAELGKPSVDADSRENSK